MTSVVEVLRDRIVGSVEEVSADRIVVQLDPEAPQATALNTGSPAGFPRIHGYVLIPNEAGATVCVISSVRIERRPFPKRQGTQRDFGLVDLPFPSRVVTLTPLGTLKSRAAEENLSFEVQRGVDVFPSVGDPVLLPSAEQLRAIVEGEGHQNIGRIVIGMCPTAGRAPVHVDPDRLFGRHLAVLGNTGAGKSCTVAGLIHWSLDAAAEARRSGGREARPNARFIVLDPNGEYARAFKDFGARVFQVDPRRDGLPLKVPAWLWNGEEWAAFTGAAPGVQRPVLFDALRRLRSDVGAPDAVETMVRGRVRRYSNQLRAHISAGDHMTAGRREGVADLLQNIQADLVPLATKCEGQTQEALGHVVERAGVVERAARAQPRDGGYYHRAFDEESLQTVVTALSQAGDSVGLEHDDVFVDEDTPTPFAVDALPGLVEALAASQSGRDVAQFVDTLTLRIRALLGRSRLGSILQPPSSTSLNLEDWLDAHIGSDQASNGPVVVVDLSLVPSEVIHVIVSVLGRMVFEAVQRYRRVNGVELPTTLVLEEAHTFVHKDLSSESAPPSGRACCRVFERIAREGRKFGLGLVLASQRPSEVSPTVLSQCNTFLLHRIVNDLDQQLVRRLVPDGLGDLLRELPSLPTRRALLLGWAAPAPVLVEVRQLEENRRPHSPDPAFWAVWSGDEERRIDWTGIVDPWQGGEADHPGEGIATGSTDTSGGA